MVKGIGVDIVEIKRIQQVLADNKRFAERVFAPSEIEYCETKARKAQHYAARFAAKEAFFKALGTGWRDGMGWHEIIVENDDLGKPRIQLSGKTLEVFNDRGLASIHLSISHEKIHAVAMVVLE